MGGAPSDRLDMVVLSVEAIAEGLWNTVADAVFLATLGWSQWQTAPRWPLDCAWG